MFRVNSAFRWIAVAALIATTAVVAPTSASAIGPASAPVATASAYAKIGLIESGGSPEGLSVSSDDTVYVPTQFANYVGIINPGTTSGQFDDSIAVTYPRSAAVGRDGTVYIANYTGQKIEVVNPGQNVVARSITVADFPRSLAVNGDDTVVAASFSNGGGSISIIASGGTTPAATITNPFSGLAPYGVAADSQGNFYVGQDGNSVGVINVNATSINRTITGLSGATSLAMGTDDTLYVASRNGNRVDIVTAGASTPALGVPVGNLPVAIAVSTDGDVFTSNFFSSNVSVISAGAATSSTLTSATSTHGVAVTSTGLIYIAQGSPASVIVMAEVGANLPVASGDAGSTTRVDISGLPVGALMDDSTVTQVWWGDDTVAFSRVSGANAVELTVPSGTGSVPVVVEVNGGGAVTAGSFTYAAAPTPAPPVPAGPAGDVVAVAGVERAEVSWSAPVVRGSFPITNYLVTSSPGGRSCVSVTTSCTVSGLTGGVEYTFSVQALTGAGWGAKSAASNPVMPGVRSISISAERTVVRGRPGVVISGTTSGLVEGRTLRVWMRFSRYSDFKLMPTRAVVDESGGFRWERRLDRPAEFFVATQDWSVVSPRASIQ